MSCFDNSKTVISLNNSNKYLEHTRSYGSLKNGMLHNENVVFKKQANNFSSICLYLPLNHLVEENFSGTFYDIILVSFPAYTN